MLSSGPATAAPGVGTISLAGTWRFRLDPKKVGVEQQWYATRLPDEIKLPGTTDEAKLGLPNPAKPSLDGLYRPNVYAGPAWYQRDIEIPADWQGKRVELLLERVHWETRVWLDGREIGTQDSLIAPQVHDLGKAVAPGKHSLTIRVDNSLKFDLGGFVSILYEGTQTNWNGIVGRIELRAVDAACRSSDVEVYPDVDRKLIKVSVYTRNASRRRVHERGHAHRRRTRAAAATVASQANIFSSDRLSAGLHRRISAGRQDQALGRVLAELIRVQGAAPPGRPERCVRAESHLRHAEAGNPRHAVRPQRPADLPPRHAGMRHLSRAPVIRPPTCRPGSGSSAC